ncbi:hypothetical protein Tco_0458018 [Tanacetum coccineum]
METMKTTSSKGNVGKPPPGVIQIYLTWMLKGTEWEKIAYLLDFKNLWSNVTLRGGATLWYTKEKLNTCTSTRKKKLAKDVGNGEPKSVVDYQKHDEDGPHNESDEKDKSEDDSSPKEVNAAR